jgi:surface polysaccharide O-acyltransferase-like enzyme
LGAVLFILVCVLTGVALIGGFIRHLDVNRSWLDLLAPSAFAIYVLHYAPLTWIQTALLASEIPAVAKASATFIGTLFVSCILAALLRQSPKLRQVL